MGLVHTMALFARGGAEGIQANQRDWSPFLVHFTSAAAMKTLRNPLGHSAAVIERRLRCADSHSFRIVEKIASSEQLKANTPTGKKCEPCICFSECTLPGLIALSERYGRFGFAFRKAKLFDKGARPCVYVDTKSYASIGNHSQSLGASVEARWLAGLSNVYRPVKHDDRPIQDCTHEREWRLFRDLNLTQLSPEFVICPSTQFRKMRRRFPSIGQLLPIDTLFEWGA